MKNYLNLLLLVIVAFAMNVNAAVTTTQKVIAPATTDLELDATTSTNQIIAKKKVQFQGKILKNAYNDPTTGTAQVLEDHTNSFVRLTGSGLVSVKGIPSGNLGDTRTIVNESGADVILLNQDATATAATRIDTGSSKDVTIKNNGAFQVMYDTVTSRWHLLSGASGGGIANWVTATSYKTNDVVIQSSKIYQALSDHTSGTFATDLAATKWTQIAKSISGKSDVAASATVEELQYPNNTFTPTGTNKYRVEHGNKNVLSNPSFEHTTYNTGWTCTGITPVAETTILGEGSKAMTLAASASTFECYNDSTLLASTYMTGAQFAALLKVYFPSLSGTSLKVCSRNNGATSTSNCVDYISKGTQALGVFNQTEIPFKGSGTSNGISITGVAVTGNITIDDAFVGPAVLRQSSSNVSNTVSFTPTGSWTTNTTYTGAWRRIGDWAYIDYKIALAGAPNSATLTLNIPSEIGLIDTTKLRDSTANLVVSDVGLLVDSGSQNYLGQAFYNTTSTVVVRSPSATSATGPLTNVTPVTQAAPFTWGSGDYIEVSIKVPIVGWGSSSSIYSSVNADTDWAACNFSSLAWQGLGTVTSNLQCKKSGSDLIISGKVTTGTTAASTAQILLPMWNGAQLSTASSAKIPTTTILGRLSRGAASSTNDFTAIASASQTVLNIGYAGTANLPTTTQLGNAAFTTGEVFYMENVRIPIDGWDQSNIIIGQFNGLESCTDSYQCTDTFTARVTSAGVVSDENLDWITGNCVMSGTNSSTATCTLKTSLFTSAPNCNWQSRSGGASRFDAATSTSTAISATGWTVAGTSTALDGFISCSKGTDYLGKTAKAVASDQNVRSIGAVGVDTQSVYFGSSADCSSACTTGTCTICNQVGSKITSVSWSATGQYNLNGIDGTKYNCNGNGIAPSVSQTTGVHIRNSSTSSLVRMSFYNSSAATANTGYAGVTCIGIP